MNRFFTALPLAATLALSSAMAVQAQDTAAPEATEEAEETTGIQDQLSLGEDADKDPDLGKPYTAEVSGAWDVRCIKTEQESDPCQLYQLINDAEDNPVAEVSIFRLPEGGQAIAGATIVVPLETSLQNQLTLAVDGGNARRYPFAFCNPVGCYVRLGLTEQDINAFKRGNEALITIVPALAPDQKVPLTMSLSGFTAGFDKASVINQ